MMNTPTYLCNIVVNEGFDKEDVLPKFKNVVNPLLCSDRVFQASLTEEDIHKHNQDEATQYIELNRNQVTDD
tara:strand:+ start:384 stop:599 length:216 start_codon:yes stop_codon:yes gene_type:complete